MQKPATLCSWAISASLMAAMTLTACNTAPRTREDSECATIVSTNKSSHADLKYCRSEFKSELRWWRTLDSMTWSRQKDNAREGSARFSVSVVYSDERTTFYKKAQPVVLVRTEVEGLPGESETVAASQSTTNAAINAGNQDTDADNVVPARHVPNLFGDYGVTTRFQGKVGKLAADFKLVMQSDENIAGSYTYPGRKQVYTLKGKVNDIGDITLTEYTNGKASATCELIPKGDCYEGQMKNADGRSFPMTMCLTDV